jgi:hypothetical protein
MAETTKAFAQATSDYGMLLDTIAARTSDVIGDRCLIALLSEDEAWLRPTSIAARDAEAAAVARHVLVDEAKPMDRTRGPMFEVVRTGVPFLLARTSTGVIAETVDARYSDAVRRIGAQRRSSLLSFRTAPTSSAWRRSTARSCSSTRRAARSWDWPRTQT